MAIGVLAIGVLAGCVLGATALAAAELKVLTAGACKPVVTALVADFEKGGHTVTIDNDTAGALMRRIDGGEAFDLAVLTPQALRELSERGKIDAASIKRLARVGIGVAIKEGAPRPSIATVDDFKQALLAARAVAYIDPAAGGSSGIYLAQLFDKLGIADAIKAKAVLVPGGLVAQRVVNGEADIGIHQISEIKAVRGATLVGPLPAEIQHYTVYAGGIGAQARDPHAAKKLIDLLAGDEAKAALKRLGMEPPDGVAGG
jgi:molybdate transport system substrate-binding protein